ncbi:hypothetical protein YA0089_18840 [Pseudomonas viridiflava]|uniref:competence protein ComJ n=1 Tax=Pseudomonas viridiflava TaxID=33069 RepID=UPI0018E661C3|nr:competence protein ComJ [Pseudomonas viridiflava]MBI6725665.1 hypothetical protein [Pseudomonas viridiflava]
MITNKVVDLLVSFCQIQVRSQAYDEKLCAWGKKNVAQGAVIHPAYVVFDPIVDDTFGANVHVGQSDCFTPDPKAQRCIAVPFTVLTEDFIEIASGTHHDVGIGARAATYSLYFEVCEGDEVYYKITFVEACEPIKPTYLMDDQWGGKKGKELRYGYA